MSTICAIWKYRLVLGEQMIVAPPVAKVVHAGLDGVGSACVWLQVVDGPAIPFRCRVLATGQQFNADVWQHCKTFVDGEFVWHLLVPADTHTGEGRCATLPSSI